MNSYASIYDRTGIVPNTTNMPWLLHPFLWLLHHWLGAYCPGLRHSAGMPQFPACQRANRYDRKISQRRVSQVRDLSSFAVLLPRGLSPTQYLERMSRISIFGRLRLYNISAVGSVLRRRAMLICYDHGWWRTPIGPMGLLGCGVWRVHLWPN